MKTKEFKIGEYYYITLNTNDDRFIITLCTGICDKDRIKGKYIGNMNGTDPEQFHFNTSTPYVTDGRTCRIATFEEKEWLNACIEVNKFVSKKDIKSRTYEIF